MAFQDSYLSLMFGDCHQNLHPELSFEGIPPEISAEGIPPELSAEGIPPELSAEGIPPELSAEGIPPELSAEGIPPELSAEGIPPPEQTQQSELQPFQQEPLLNQRAPPSTPRHTRAEEPEYGIDDYVIFWDQRIGSVQFPPDMSEVILGCAGPVLLPIETAFYLFSRWRFFKPFESMELEGEYKFISKQIRRLINEMWRLGRNETSSILGVLIESFKDLDMCIGGNWVIGSIVDWESSCDEVRLPITVIFETQYCYRYRLTMTEPLGEGTPVAATIDGKMAFHGAEQIGY